MRVSLTVMRRLPRQRGAIGFATASGRPCVEVGKWQDWITA